MQVQIKLFGIAKEIFQGSFVPLEMNSGAWTVRTLKAWLEENQPGLKSIGSYRIAVNHAFADDDAMIVSTDTIALIPPVSGG